MKSILFILDIIVLSSATTVRLRGNDSTSYQGRVEVNHNGTWGTICDDYWTDDDAAVICRMLNFRNGGKAYGNAHFGTGSGRIWLDDVNCTFGHTVNNISDCHHPGWGNNNCGHNEDAGVMCTLTGIRLVNGSRDDNGRVEVYHHSSWGTICDDGWTDTNSKVVCQQLGYRDQLYYNGSARYGQGTGPILMDGVHCYFGNITDRIWNCSFNGWGLNDCHHREDIGVACATNSVRLVNGHSRQTGRVEILQNGRWGTVCDDRFSDDEARVVCRMFGYKYGIAYGAHFGAGNGTIYVDELNCPARYSSDMHALLLGDTLCSFNGWGSNNCDHSEDVGVWCTSHDLRLRSERLSGQGRVEINYANLWGTICSDDWDTVAAKLACRILGFRGGIPFRPIPGSGRIWLDNVRCSASTSDIAQCSHNSWGTHNCDHYKDAGVWCVKNAYDVVLADGSDHSGRVEIYDGSSFTTLCYGYIDTHNADVLCRLVGHRYGGKMFKYPNYVGTTISWLRHLRCEGTETRLRSCTGTWRSYRCPGGSEIWIDCITSCDEGKFGHLCSQKCHCKVPGCDIGTGRCRSGGCLPGWQGSTCSLECGFGTFGQSCSSRCHCGTTGCDPVTGVCTNQGGGCEDGWTGYSCNQKCVNGTFGQACGQSCHCKTPGCDPMTGVCSAQFAGCEDGWTGSSCNRVCEFRKFGRSCDRVCHCNSMGCDPVTGVCIHQSCAPGWTGTSCDRECGLGSFGGFCFETCNCLISGCNPVTGVCHKSGCQSGWIGQSCNTLCGYKTFGESCSTRCHCRSSGCDPVTGVCTNQGDGCLDGWTGGRCDQECRNETFGKSCSSRCNCRTPGCDPVTGVCTHDGEGCDDGWTGYSCSQECDLGLYGSNCIETCHCLIPGCNPITGVCNTTACMSEWMGQSCNISFQQHQENTSESGSTNIFIAVVCLGVLLVASIAIIIGLFVTRKRNSANKCDNDPCYQNVQRRQLDTTVTSQPDYEDLQVHNVTRKAYENVSYESGYDNVEFHMSE